MALNDFFNSKYVDFFAHATAENLARVEAPSPTGSYACGEQCYNDDDVRLVYTT